MKTYPVAFAVEHTMPTSLFDPRWQDAEVAARVAFVLYCRLPLAAASDPLVDGADPALDAPADKVDARRFALAFEHAADDGTRMKGGSYGELHRHYSFGKYTANFHAQAVAFGVDSSGHFFLSSNVGRFDGPWGNRAILEATFCAGERRVGSARFERDLDPAGDVRVLVAGKDARIASAYNEIDRADVRFVALTGVETSPPPKEPVVSKAKQAALARRAKAGS